MRSGQLVDGIANWLQRKVRGNRISNLAGSIPGAMGAELGMIADQPRHRDDSLFWQYPCRTEGAAWALHAELVAARLIGDEMHLYLGLPWATWIDKMTHGVWGLTGQQQAERLERHVGVRLSGISESLHDFGVRLRVHTVCQHILWPMLLPRWRVLGVTDLWLSHCPPDAREDLSGEIMLHPWRLFAVNVEDPSRTGGLSADRDPAERSLLASFVGAYAPCYLADTRLRLSMLATEPDITVEISERWHFDDVVYKGQIHGRAMEAKVDSKVTRYNRLLSDSVFSFCPTGSGANTLRLWESLACGSIPVLFEPWPVLPVDGAFAGFNWSAAVLWVHGDDLSDLPDRLRAIPLSERRERARLCRQAFARARELRCF